MSGDCVEKNRSFVCLYSITGPSILKIKWYFFKNKLFLSGISKLAKPNALILHKGKGDSNNMKTSSLIHDSNSVVLTTAYLAKIHTEILNRKKPNHIVLLTCDYWKPWVSGSCLNISIYSNKQRLITCCCLRMINSKYIFITKELCIL